METRNTNTVTQLPKGWATISLGELAAEMCLGKMLDKNKNRGTLQPYLRNVNVRWFGFDLTDMKEMRFEPGEETRFGLQSGDLVICEGGEPGRAAVWKGEIKDPKIQKALHRVRFRSDTYAPSFAMYYLFYGTTTNNFAQHYTGTTIKHLTGKALRQVPFPVPPINEQRRIVAKLEELLSDLDAGEAALQRVRANLKRYRASVLKSAVEGRLTEAWRSQNPPKEPASDLLARILKERRKRWEEHQLATYQARAKKPPKGWQSKYKEPVAPKGNDLPELPRGWCWTTMEQLISRSEYGTSTKCGYDAPGDPVLRIPNIAGRTIDLGDMKYCTKSLDLDADTALRTGDLLMCRTNGSIRLIGKSALVTQDYQPFHSFASYLLRFRFVISELVPAWVHLYVGSIYGRRFIETHAASSAGQHNVSLTLIHGMALPLPPLSELKEILASADESLSISEQTEELTEFDLRRSDRLRQSILKRAFEGKLVPQDPKDEPADRLLQRILAEKPRKEAKKRRKRKAITRKKSG